ncbi:Hypothetical protein DHA2_153049 [Giardia duodenalis]|uniref:Uncharacterized protein n=1 Tax=Giardia intestinalis TaxID=5741 RepID=V6TCV3_GIAIN|nr:Hypothetical protein DHA2_153049 [Giardia intestinalis]
MHNSHSISSRDLASLEYPLVCRDEESLELSELYDTEPCVDPSNSSDILIAGRKPDTSAGLGATTRQSARIINTSKPRIVSPIAPRSIPTIEDHVHLYQSNLQKIISDLKAYVSITNHPNLSAQDIPKICVEKLDTEEYRRKFTARTKLSTALLQQAMSLRKRIEEIQRLLDNSCTQPLSEKLPGKERALESSVEGGRPLPIYDRLLPATRSPVYEQNCRVIWASSESFVLLAHIKHSSDMGTDLFVAHVDTELSRFQQDSNADPSADKGSVICTLTFWLKKKGNQLLLQFLCNEFLEAYRPTLQGSDQDVSVEPKHIREKCSLDMLGTALGLGIRQSLSCNMLQLTFRDISSHAAKHIIAVMSDVFQRFYAQLQIWGALRTPQIVFLTYYRACPHLFASKSDKLMSFLGSQIVGGHMEPELKILSAKSTTLQTFSGNCLYCKLYVAQSLESVIVRLTFQQNVENHIALTFTAFRFSSGEAISDDDVRTILAGG